MTIEELGNIGEFISSIAVVVSLIYLALQVRQNSTQVQENVKALKRVEMNETTRGYSSLRSLVIQSDTLSDLIIRANANPEALTEAEKHRASTYVNETIWLNFHVWLRESEGYFHSGNWERGQKKAIAEIVQSPLGKEVWLRTKDFLREEYVIAVENSLREHSPQQRADDGT